MGGDHLKRTMRDLICLLLVYSITASGEKDGRPLTISKTTDIRVAEAIEATITSVTITGSTLMTFELNDRDGNPVTGLPPGAISFVLAKLVPGRDGNSSAWQSYINGIEMANEIGPGREDQVHARTENGNLGKLIDNGDGSYEYTYAKGITRQAEVRFEPDLTHRAGFELRGFGRIDNPTYDWLPSTGATTGLFSRELVQDSSCNRCHEKLAVHGDARFQSRYCVVCHNPGSTDAQSGNSVDMTTMIHKIHYGSNLPSVRAGGEYAIWGFRDVKHDYSKVVHPQDIRNCRNCHNEVDPETPDAARWFVSPTVEACASCHDDVDFESGENHAMGISAGNGECTICHRPGNALGVAEAHVIAERIAAETFQFNIVDIVNTRPGEFPVATISVTDPTRDGELYTLANEPAFAGNARVVVNLAWDNRDINNAGSGSGLTTGNPAQPISLNVLADGMRNTNGTYSVASEVAIPETVAGSGIVALEGRAAIDLDNDGRRNSIPIAGRATSYAITDSIAVARRQVVTISRCNDCHQSLSLHGANRTDNIELCLTCHNPDATDIAARRRGAADRTNSPDGKDEETIDFKTMVHAIHAGVERDNGFYAYGFFGAPIGYDEVIYPGRLANCEGCHRHDTYYPVGASSRAVTISTGVDVADPNDDINVTPNTAACWGCHDQQAAVVHMEAHGGAFDVRQNTDGLLVSDTRGVVIETCHDCHGPGQSVDVKRPHGIE